MDGMDGMDKAEREAEMNRGWNLLLSWPLMILLPCVAIGIACWVQGPAPETETADPPFDEAAVYKAGFEDGYQAGVVDGAHGVVKTLSVKLEDALIHAQVTERRKATCQ